MRLLPCDIQQRVNWDHPQLISSSDVLRKWLKEKAKQLTRGSYGQTQPKSNLHSLEKPDGEQDPEDDELHALEDMPREQLLAYVRKFQKRPARPNGEGAKAPKAGERRDAAPDRREAPPRDERDVRCGNCGEKGHTSRDCK